MWANDLPSDGTDFDLRLANGTVNGRGETAALSKRQLQGSFARNDSPWPPTSHVTPLGPFYLANSYFGKHCHMTSGRVEVFRIVTEEGQGKWGTIWCAVRWFAQPVARFCAESLIS